MNLYHIIYKFYIQWRQEKIKCLALWKVWRYQSGNQNSKSKNDRQQYDQRKTAIDQETRTPFTNEGEIGCSGRG